jgi:major membrane immunogen (membrane-anchored lipoprotein)
MKEIIIKITFENGSYKGHGEDVSKLILNGLKNFMQIDLEDDCIITKKWTIEIIDYK